jgi:hypothetical protein
MERTEATLALMLKDPHAPLLTIVLDYLSLGRAWLERGRKEHLDDPHAEPWTRARGFLDRAVTGLREAGDQSMLVLGLLARAAYFRWYGDFDAARADLCEAREIAESGDMKLHLCDYHLEAAPVRSPRQNHRRRGTLPDRKDHYRRDGILSKERGKQLLTGFR